jgi:hypothetical protein
MVGAQALLLESGGALSCPGATEHLSAFRTACTVSAACRQLQTGTCFGFNALRSP